MVDPSHYATHHDDSHGGSAQYWWVFLGLLMLTACSVIIGNSPLMNYETIAWTSMMAVSICKALLVMLYFMHLKWEANWKYVLTIPASMMSLFLVVALVPDIGMRYYHYTDARLLHASEEDARYRDELTGVVQLPGEHAAEHADEHADDKTHDDAGGH
ncbi:cytochrome C oxidase subunit IV family protein [Lignipirellula cremea]|uniref:Prokaryotic Cytochrome C oxidase subunit IV n=1 Tax=Lignipirellula cremea TaxID=2528010 RepID=A0A518DYY3_9BACT|nr:cytochrome C oxidase subunit IV family protein [Lignipirellula cremea]QDU97015.1 hypothetical protein Pla8534_48400 [Lignipirellula cremea]